MKDEYMNIYIFELRKCELHGKIIAVLDTTFAVVKRKPEKNHACMGFELVSQRLRPPPNLET